MSLRTEKYYKTPVLVLLLVLFILSMTACGKSAGKTGLETSGTETAGTSVVSGTNAAEEGLTVNGSPVPTDNASIAGNNGAQSAMETSGATPAQEYSGGALYDLSGKTAKELIEMIKNGDDLSCRSAEAELIKQGTSALDVLKAVYTETCKIEELRIEAGGTESDEVRAAMKKFGSPSNELSAIQNSMFRVFLGIGKPAVLPLLQMVDSSDIPTMESNISGIISSIGKDAVDELITNLIPKRYESSLCAIETLGSIGDPKAVEPLITIAKGENGWDGMRSDAAFYSLKEIGEAAVMPLIDLLNSRKSFPNEDAIKDAAVTLGEIGDLRAINPLLEKLGSKDSSMRFSAARGLAGYDDSSVTAALDDALKNSKLDIIAGASNYFIDRSDPSNRDMLVRALNKYGDSETAEDFLNSDDEKLKEAGRKWAEENGYMINSIPIPSFN